MQMRLNRTLVSVLGAGALSIGALSGCAEETDQSEVQSSQEALSSATIKGRVFDMMDLPVAGAEAIVMNGSQQTEYRTFVGADGSYTLRDVPVNLLLNKEAVILFVTPKVDLPPLGTVEGDYIHEMPMTINQFIEPLEIGVKEEIMARPAYVPLQAKGYTLTPEVMANGGDFTWTYPDDGLRGELTVTLRVAPGAMNVPEDVDYQNELTMTPVDYFKTPMRIPNGGAGALWTIQPREITFDPPAEITLVGDRGALLGSLSADSEIGDAIELYGATYVEGWYKFGDAHIADLTEDKVTIDSNGGIIPKGAWGHVLGAEGVNAAVIVHCKDCDADGNLVPVACQIDRDLSVAPRQPDWTDDQVMRTDNEIRARAAGVDPFAMAAVGLWLTNDGAQARLHITQADTQEAWTFTAYDVDVNERRVLEANFCAVDGFYP
ncbi:MAG: carboxypeptidase-like regulatory domain-containing protein [Bradymonadia bacterium]